MIFIHGMQIANIGLDNICISVLNIVTMLYLKDAWCLFPCCLLTYMQICLLTRICNIWRGVGGDFRINNFWFLQGNLGRVDYITEHEYDLFVRPDTCNPRFRVWFNFTVENVRADQVWNKNLQLQSSNSFWFSYNIHFPSFFQRIIFNIVNFSKTKSLYREGMSPVVKSSSRPKWYLFMWYISLIILVYFNNTIFLYIRQRIPSKNVYYYRCPDHRKNYVMSFTFCFDRDDESEVYHFSYSFPYTYTRLQNYLDKLERKCMPYFKRELLTLTVVGSYYNKSAF